MSVKNSTDLKSTINSELADNNAGAISALDIRHNMVDIVDSIVPVVASGDFSTYPFDNGIVKFKSVIDVGSGLFFDTDNTAHLDGDEKYQWEPYPGSGNVSHDTLADLDTGDKHTQYISVSGIRMMTGNFGLGGITENWINHSGEATLLETDNHGLHFSMTNPEAAKYGEVIHVGSGNQGGMENTYTKFKFDYDNSEYHTAKTNALAWISFNGSAYVNGSLSDSGLSGIAVTSSYNISAIQASGAGTYKIFFKDGLLGAGNTNYAVIAHSNGTTSNSSPQSMDLVTPAVVVREDDFFTLAVRNDNGEFVNSRRNDIVVYGLQSGVIPEASITVQNFT